MFIYIEHRFINNDYITLSLVCQYLTIKKKMVYFFATEIKRGDCMDAPDSKVKSLYKALSLLDYFDMAHPDRSITELASETGMLKSTVYNILSTFAALGYITQDETTHRYRLGYKFLEISYLIRKTNSFQRQMRPFLEKAAHQTGESVTYAIRSGIETIYLDTAYPPMATVVRLNIGARYPLYSTAGGKAILANSEPAIFERVCSAGLTAFTQHTLTSRQQLAEEMELIHQQGYAVDNMENEYGLRGFAVPIWDSNNMLMGAISLSGPSPRISDQRIREFFPIFQAIQTDARSLSA